MTVAPKISVQAEDFDAALEAANLTSQSKNIGAVVSFTGLCRDEDGQLSALELEHYPGMAEAQLPYPIIAHMIGKNGGKI